MSPRSSCRYCEMVRATCLQDGRILLAGGATLGSAEIFDPATFQFTATAGNLTTPRWYHGSALLQDGTVLIAGGADASSTVLGSTEIFTPATGSFAPLTVQLNAPRETPLVRVLPDGKALIIGGNNDSTFELIDPMGPAMRGPAKVLNDTNMLSDILRSGTRAALIHPIDPNDTLLQAQLTAPTTELLDRAGASLTELSGSNQALVAGGANSAGQFLSSAQVVASSAATITTNRSDYPPGATVNISGAGWQPGETVLITVHEEPPAYPDPVLTSVTDANGNFMNPDFSPGPSDLGRTFTLTAVGQSSGFTAQTTLTDNACTWSTTTTNHDWCNSGNWTTCGAAWPGQNNTNDTVTIGSMASSDILLGCTPNFPIASLTISAGSNAILNQGSGKNLTVAGNVTLSGGTWNASAGGTTSNQVKGNFTVSGGTFNAGNSNTTTFNGTATQTISGSPTFNSLTCTNSGTSPQITLSSTTSSNITVTGTLALGSNILSTNSNTLTVGNSSFTGAQVSRSSGYVIGTMQRWFPTGAASWPFDIGSGTSYTPISVAFPSVTTAGWLTATTTATDRNVGTPPIDQTKSVNRYWTLTNSGTSPIAFSAAGYNVTPTYVSGDLDSGVTCSNFKVARYDRSAATWSSPTTSQSPAPTCTSITATGITQLGTSGVPGAGTGSDFAVGQQQVGPLDHFAISAIASPQTVGTAFTIGTITAQDANNNTVTSFASTVTFGGTAGMTGTSAAFTSGVLSNASVTPTVAGSNLTVTVSDGASHTGLATITTINPGAATKLVFTSTAVTVTAGVASGMITVQRQDASGNPITTEATTRTVTLSSNSTGTVTFNPTSLSIANGSSSATFTYTDTKAGTPTITAASTSPTTITSATQQETVNAAAASKLVFTTTAVTVPVGVASGTITVQRQDQYNNPNTTDAARTVTLSSTSGGTVTFTPASPLSIPNGSSNVSFTYTDTQAGTPTITAASTSPTTITSATQQETVNAVASKLGR